MNPEFDAILFESMEVASFDSVAWVNKLLEASGNDADDEALLNAVRSASSRLQMRSQELSRDAERLMERMLSVGPRAVQELDRVERDAMALKQDLKRLQDETKLSTSSNAPFHTLKNLDIIKTNLEKCVNVLQETGNWNSLVREMESYFAARNLGEVASRLSTLRATVETLKGFPEASKRADVMERMEQRLEALVRPGLQHALEQAIKGDYEPLKQSVVVFEKLGRREGLLTDFGESRGKACFDACWVDKGRVEAEDDKHMYSRFLDKVLARLREVEIPLCKYAFETPEAASEAVAWVIRSCFQNITAETITKLHQPEKKARMNESSCERYVLAHEATIRFSKDVTTSILNSCTVTSIKNMAVQSITLPFVEVDRKYLEWESDALILSLESNIQEATKHAEDALDDLLGPTGWEQRMVRVKAEDILEQLVDNCLNRCSRIQLSALVPICRLFDSHAKKCLGVVRENRKADDATRETTLLKIVVMLKTRFTTALSKCQYEPVKDSNPEVGSPGGGRALSISQEGKKHVEDTLKSLSTLTAEARLKLFSAFLSPALALLDEVISVSETTLGTSIAGPSETITKCVDHLYSLIPLLEFDMTYPDLIANATILGKVERDELHSTLGGAISYGPPLSSQESELTDDPDGLLQLISSSWLEAVGRAMCTGFTLRVTRLKKVTDIAAAQLGADADCLEKNVGTVLGQGVPWDPALGVCRVVLSAGPGLTHLKLGNPMQHLDDKYYSDEGSFEQLKALEHMLVGLRTRS